MSTETSVPLPRVPSLGTLDSALLEVLLKEAPLGFAFFDTQHRFQRVNRTLAAVYGKSATDCQGRTPAEVLECAGDVAEHDRALAAVLAGEPAVYSDQRILSAPRSDNADAQPWAMSWFPAHQQDGGIAGVVLITLDLSDEQVVEAALRRGEERYRSLLRATNQVVWSARPDGNIVEDCPEWRAITGQSIEQYLGQGWLETIHPDDRQRVEHLWQEAVVDSATFDTTFRVRSQSGDFRNFRSRAVPILRGGAVIEWVGANIDVTTQHEADDMRQRLTQQLGEAALRTVRLQKATSDLAEALTVDQVVQAITEIGWTAVGADRTAVAQLDRERLRLRVLSQRADDVPGDQPEEAGLEHPGTMSQAARERKPFIAGSPLELRALLHDASSVIEFLSSTDEQAWVALPLVSAGLPIGALRFAFTNQREISEEERVFLEALAGQCALALERATLFEREHRTAEALQKSLLPEELPEVKGVRMQSSYSPGTQHVQVGGDWYDAFPLPDGRVAGVLGDVMGKGIKAATGMSRVRNALRALAFSMPEPAEVLTGLDRMFDATEEVDQVTTLVYFVLDPETGQIDLSNAGHLPPLVVAENTEPWLLRAEPGTPLGVSSQRGHHNFFVQPGNTVVLYSDGLVENRKRPVAAGLDELVSMASQAPPGVVGDPQEVLNYLVEGMLTGYEQDDDVTLLAVHLPVLQPEPDE